MADKFNFNRVRQNFERVKRELPILVANDTQNFFAKNFSNQGFDDGGLKPWLKRKKETKKTIGKNILVGTGKLRRAVQNSSREKTWDKIRFVIDGGSIPYAKVHNEGSDKMPQRQFIGDSKTLRLIQVKRIKGTIDKIWKA